MGDNVALEGIVRIRYNLKGLEMGDNQPRNFLRNQLFIHELHGGVVLIVCRWKRGEKVIWDLSLSVTVRSHEGESRVYVSNSHWSRQILMSRVKSDRRDRAMLIPVSHE